METNNKKCPFCHEEIKPEAVKCKHCGEWLNKNKSIRIYSGKVSVKKFIFLYFATLSVYPIFWMYDQWKYLKEKENLNVTPALRVFFGAVTAGSLASYIKKFVTKHNISVSYNSLAIGIGFFLLNALSILPSYYWLICFLSFIPLLPLLKAMNEHYEKSDLPESGLRWWQIILAIFGFMVFLLAIAGTFLPE